jgi:hypothetical protein
LGWQLKIIALIVALAAIPFGAWIISVPLFIYVISGFIRRRKKQQQQIIVQMTPSQYEGENPPYAPAPHPIQSSPMSAPPRFRYSKTTVVRYILGSIFLLLALMAVGVGGTLSPLVFGIPGLILILWGPFSKAARFSAIKPLHDSILLRTRFPLLWVSMAEVKLATQQPARPISSIGERVLIFASESPSAYLVIQRLALNHRGAEERMLERMRELAKAMAPLGAYVLPLDSSKVADRLNLSLEDLKIDPESWKQNLSTVHYDVLAVECKEGYVRSFAAYVKDGKKPRGKPLLPSAGRKPARPPLLWELLHPVGTRVRWAGPDVYTAFLSSMAATEAATIGERVIDMGSAQDSQVMHVRSVGSPTVELSRPELRAIVRIYSAPSKEGVVQAVLQKIRV